MAVFAGIKVQQGLRTEFFPLLFLPGCVPHFLFLFLHKNFRPQRFRRTRAGHSAVWRAHIPTSRGCTRVSSSMAPFCGFFQGRATSSHILGKVGKCGHQSFPRYVFAMCYQAAGARKSSRVPRRSGKKTGRY